MRCWASGVDRLQANFHFGEIGFLEQPGRFRGDAFRAQLSEISKAMARIPFGKQAEAGLQNLCADSMWGSSRNTFAGRPAVAHAVIQLRHDPNRGSIACRSSWGSNRTLHLKTQAARCLEQHHVVRRRRPSTMACHVGRTKHIDVRQRSALWRLPKVVRTVFFQAIGRDIQAGKWRQEERGRRESRARAERTSAPPPRSRQKSYAGWSPGPRHCRV